MNQIYRAVDVLKNESHPTRSNKMSECKPTAGRIKVIGIGKAGCSVITKMVREGIHGLEYIAMDTDADCLALADVPVRRPLGTKLTAGLGSGGDPVIGLSAAEENRDEIEQAIEGADVVFLVAGLGGGTGTGSMPVVAELARQGGALTIGIVTKPFDFEGRRWAQIAEESVEQLISSVNTLIVLETDRMIELTPTDWTVDDCFRVVDECLCHCLKTMLGLVLNNGNRASIKTILKNMGPATMGVGSRPRKNGGVNAAKDALLYPQLQDCSLKEIKKVIVSISSYIVVLSKSKRDNIVRAVKKEIHPDAIVRSRVNFDSEFYDDINVTLICEYVGKPRAPK